jgi:hypothetical protein
MTYAEPMTPIREATVDPLVAFPCVAILNQINKVLLKSQVKSMVVVLQCYSLGSTVLLGLAQQSML